MYDMDFLRLLSKDFPNRKAATSEIINLRAIMALPKGTEYFLSDIHGEFDAFNQIIRSASGTIKAKIDEHFGQDMNDEQRENLAALIYNPEAEIARRKKDVPDFEQWCKENIYALIVVCRSVSTKYTRSKVRNTLPKYWAYSIDELLHADDEENKARYYSEIIQSVIDSGMAEDFICEMARAVSRLAVDSLHIIGDVFDRGAHSDDIMDFLIDYDDVDFQWGNHDILWIGAACGNWACMTNMLRINIRYYNFDMLEVGYGINLRPLSQFAREVYGDDPCEVFRPKILERSKFDEVSSDMAAKMHKAIAICQFKVEGQRIKAHPEYGLESRLLLDKIDFKNGTIDIAGKTYEMLDMNFPTVDPDDPYRLTEGEEKLLKSLAASVMRSEKLQRHIAFMMTHGSMYKIMNNNLLYHGCIPMDEDGNFLEITLNGRTYSGRALFDYLDEQVRRLYFTRREYDGNGDNGDLIWYLWLGPRSPFFAKDQMTTFERLYIADKSTHVENANPYYSLISKRETAEKILREFGLDPEVCHVITGHVPVKIKDGESPIKAGGKLFIIDGGISKAYHKTTGIAGYTFIYNSRFMALAEHKPYEPLQPDGTQVFHSPVMHTVEVLPSRMMVRDTEQGVELQKQVEELRSLIEAYKDGRIKERY
ncbi:MAG: fructose-1,6-bisphosphatase [Anaerovoracaceae bacterium]|nr:fructose-1,6-bisphosphatase [Anaerovoracaceae bacterium]